MRLADKRITRGLNFMHSLKSREVLEQKILSYSISAQQTIPVLSIQSSLVETFGPGLEIINGLMLLGCSQTVRPLVTTFSAVEE